MTNTSRGSYQVIFYEHSSDIAFTYSGISSNLNNTIIGIQHEDIQFVQYNEDNLPNPLYNRITFTKLGSNDLYITNYAFKSSVEPQNDIVIQTGNFIIDFSNSNNRRTKLPFQFRYSDNSFTHIAIDHKGIVYLENNSNGASIPIYVFNLGVDNYNLSNSGLRYIETSINNEEVVVVSWDNIYPYCNLGSQIQITQCIDSITLGDYSFQLHLYKSGIIKFVYTDLDGGSLNYNYGNNARLADIDNLNTFFNNNPYIQVNGSSAYAYVVTAYRPTLQAIDFPLCADNNSVGYFNVSPFISAFENIVINNNNATAINNKLVSINQTGIYSINAKGWLKSSNLYAALPDLNPLHISDSLETKSFARPIEIHQYTAPLLLTLDLNTSLCSQVSQSVNISEYYTHPSYLWNTGETENNILSNSSIVNTVTVTEHHRICSSVLTKTSNPYILQPILLLSQGAFHPIVLGSGNRNLTDLLIFLENNYHTDSTFIVEFSGANVSNNQFMLNQITMAGDYNIDIDVYNTDSCQIASGSFMLKVLAPANISGLDSTYCNTGSNLPINITRNQDYSYTANQYLGGTDNRHYYINENEWFILIRDHNNNLIDTLNRNSQNINTQAININNYPNGFTIFINYYNKITIKNGTSSTATTISTNNYLVSSDSMTVQVGNAIIAQFDRTNLSFNSNNAIALCEHYLNHRFTVSSNDFSSNNRGMVYVYLGNNLLDSIQPNLDREIYINPAEIDNDNIDNTYFLIYRKGSSVCNNNIADTLRLLITEVPNADFSYTGPVCSNSAPITLQPTYNSNSSFFTINGRPILDNIFDVSNLPNITNPIGTHRVSYHLIDTNNCSNTSSQDITVVLAPNANITSTKNEYCGDYIVDEIALSVSPIGGNFSNYSLSESSTSFGMRTVALQNTNSTTANHYTINPDLFTNTQTDTIIYTYTVSNSNGCTGTAIQEIIVHKPIAINHFPLPTNLCRDNSVIINLNVQPSATIVSSNNNSTNLNIQNKTYTPATVTTPTDRIYFNYTDPITGCKSRDSVIVTVNGNSDNLSFTQALPNNICANTTDSFLIIANMPNGTFICNSPNALVHANSNGQVYFKPSLLDTGIAHVNISYEIISAQGCNTYITTQANIIAPQIPTLLAFKDPNNRTNNVTAICENEIAILDIPLSEYSRFTNRNIQSYSTNTNLALSIDGTGATIFNADLIDPAYRYGNHTFNIRATDINNCSTLDTFTLDVKTNPKPIRQGLTDNYCLPASGTLAPINFSYLPSTGYLYNYTTTRNNPSAQLYRLLVNPNPNAALPTPRSNTDFITNNQEMNYITRHTTNNTIVQFHPTFEASNIIIYEVKYENGCVNSDSVIVEVRNTPLLEIIPINDICHSQKQFDLQANINGILATDSVRFFNNSNNGAIQNNTYTINTAILPSQDIIIAEYRSLAGCSVRDTITVNFKSSPVITLSGLNNSYCNTSPDHTIRGHNNNTLASGIQNGVFYNYNANATIITIIDDSTALFHPSNIIDNDTIYYALTSSNGCTDTLKQYVTIDTNIQYEFTIERAYCNNDTRQMPISTNATNGELTITYLADNSILFIGNTNTTIQPSSLNLGAYEVKYIATPNNGCHIAIKDTFHIYNAPDASIQVTNGCIGDNIQAKAIHINPNFHYIWQQGNNGLFMDTTITIDSRLQGSFDVQLTITDPNTNCASRNMATINIYGNPSFSINNIGGCINDSTEFKVTLLNTAIDNITNISFDFADGNTSQITPNSTITQYSQNHLYNNHGVYYVTVTVSNFGVCHKDTIIRTIISPSIDVLPNRPYLDTFNQYSSNWIAGLTANGDSVWGKGPIDKSFLKTGNNTVWGIQPQDSFISNNIGSWIYAPCLNINSLDRPMIKFDLATHLHDNEGLTIQYLYVNNDTIEWRNLGEFNKGVNWFNTNQLLSLQDIYEIRLAHPLYRGLGWNGIIGTLNATDSITIFSDARYRLDKIKNSAKPLRLRLGFTSSSQNIIDNREGLMFDNFFVGNRSKKVLLEYIHNSDSSVLHSNRYVRNIVYTQEYIKDVAFIQYHLPEDEFTINQSNEALHNHLLSNRSSTIESGAVIMDRNIFYNKPHESAMQLSTNHIDAQMLEDAKIKIDNYRMIIDNTNHKIYVSGTITALQDIEIPIDESLAHYTLLSQNYVDWYVHGRNEQHMSVLRDGLIAPTYGYFKEEPIVPLGTQVFAAGETYQLSGEFPLNNRLENLSNLIFNNTNNLAATTFIILGLDTLLQVEQYNQINITNLPPEATVSIDELDKLHEQGKEIFSFRLYPNPAINYTTLAFDQALSKAYYYTIFDIQGRMVKQDMLHENTLEQQITIEYLPTGTYIIQLKDALGTVEAYRKLVVIKP